MLGNQTNIFLACKAISSQWDCSEKFTLKKYQEGTGGTSHSLNGKGAHKKFILWNYFGNTFLILFN